MRMLKIGLLILGGILLGHYATRAQSPQAYTMSGSAAHTTCPTPAAGVYYLCVASDGIWVSNNGAAYFQIVAPTASGVTSIAVNGGTAQTGAVLLTIPTRAATTATTTLQ